MEGSCLRSIHKETEAEAGQHAIHLSSGPIVKERGAWREGQMGEGQMREGQKREGQMREGHGERGMERGAWREREQGGNRKRDF